MTEPDDRQHTSDPAEGADEPSNGGGQTPHSEEPAEGADDRPTDPPIS
jgi:hypothetical protein